MWSFSGTPPHATQSLCPPEDILIFFCGPRFEQFAVTREVDRKSLRIVKPLFYESINLRLLSVQLRILWWFGMYI